ncbi:hypothetical protein [Microbacterium sp. MYb62]|uniref:hypothetical protein n=1 Tax=Microbacterium sp. MYb62 TaxID=1848690 RepID=UPI000CFBBB4E|nr:hypothetical protein [Microbacterium sp. MYb62]PRB12223.1 hypothetical protein CQ042_15540 [Microbacterium sp. MYb62]
MSVFDWRDAGFGATTADTPFAEVIGDAISVLGVAPTIAEGPFVRWYDGARQVTVRPSRSGGADILVEPAGAAADEEYRDFESLPDTALPYHWRADDIALLPNGSHLPGERFVDDFAALAPAVTQTLVTLCEATAALGDGRSEAQVHVWYADPAHDALARAERWSARRKTSVSIGFKAGTGRIHVLPIGAKAHAERISFPATPENASEAAVALMAQILATGAPNPAALRQDSLLFIERRRLALSPFALGIPRADMNA